MFRVNRERLVGDSRSVLINPTFFCHQPTVIQKCALQQSSRHITSHPLTNVHAVVPRGIDLHEQCQGSVTVRFKYLFSKNERITALADD